MPAYKDKDTGKWFCKFYYQEPKTGKRKQKMRRGFERKREAEAYEREFLTNLSYSPSMPFAEFYERYRADKDPQLQAHTIQTRLYQMRRILPVFGDMPLDAISALDVTQWHNELIGEGLSQTYINNLHTCLSSIFNHAIKFYGLRVNPCTQSGRAKMTDPKKKELRFWTYEQFRAVDLAFQGGGSESLKDRTIINLMYWTGMRKGEFRALNWADIDFQAGEVFISKSYQRLKGGKETITTTKTGVSRSVKLPAIVLDLLDQYRNTCYDSSPESPIFPYGRVLIENVIERGCELSGVPSINVHGLRHSHASLLIQLDTNVVLISKRLGHEKVSTTLDTYSHFFPDDEIKAVERMEQLNNDTNLILEKLGDDKT